MWWFLHILHLPDQWNKCPSACEHYRALVSRLPILVFRSSERLVPILDQTSGPQFSSLVVAKNVRQSLPGPHVSFWRFFFQKCELLETCPRIWETSILVHIPTIIFSFFLQHIQICVKWTLLPQCISVEQGMFLPSARRVELEVHCDDDIWGHLLFLSVETLPVRHEVLHWDLHSLRVVPALEWVLGIRGPFLAIVLYHLPLGI